MDDDANRRSSKVSKQARSPSTLAVRLDEKSKEYLTNAAALRGISVGDYGRTVTMAKPRKKRWRQRRKRLL
jgi:hypothetical protein